MRGRCRRKGSRRRKFLDLGFHGKFSLVSFFLSFSIKKNEGAEVTPRRNEGQHISHSAPKRTLSAVGNVDAA